MVPQAGVVGAACHAASAISDGRRIIAPRSRTPPCAGPPTPPPPLPLRFPHHTPRTPPILHHAHTPLRLCTTQRRTPRCDTCYTHARHLFTAYHSHITTPHHHTACHCLLPPHTPFLPWVGCGRTLVVTLAASLDDGDGGGRVRGGCGYRRPLVTWRASLPLDNFVSVRT